MYGAAHACNMSRQVTTMLWGVRWDHVNFDCADSAFLLPLTLYGKVFLANKTRLTWL